MEVQFARQHGHIGITGIEAQGLDVGDIELGGEMHLLPYFATINQHCHIRSYHGGNAGLERSITDATHHHHIIVVNNGVHREISLHSPLGAHGGYLAQVGYGETTGRMGTHIETLDAEIHRIGTGFQGCRQTLARTDGCHHLKAFGGEACKVGSFQMGIHYFKLLIQDIIVPMLNPASSFCSSCTNV